MQTLTQLMATYGWQIPHKQLDNWRMTYRVSGDCLGIVEDVELLATDGLLAFFLLGDGKSWIIGHLANFRKHKTEREATPREATHPKGERKRKFARQILLENL